MGGGHLHCFASEDELSTLDDDDYSQNSSFPFSSYRNGLKTRDGDDLDELANVSYGFGGKEFGGGHVISSNAVEFNHNLRRRKIAYNEIMRYYDEYWVRTDSFYQAKTKILSYAPGAWISYGGDKKQQNRVIPKTTTLLVIGPKGCGKSSLVNRISRVFEDDKFFSERAQVAYNSSAGDGTFFLQEYMVPRDSTSFCLFDTRSLSGDFVDDDKMLQHWITKGVRHGDVVIRDSDSPSLKMTLKYKAQLSGATSTEIRKVNFVVFVVNGLSVLKAMNSCRKEHTRYMETVTKTFSCPFLSYKDDKPAIVVTHGDLLSLGDRARLLVYLGEQLGVPPLKQIFDIPDNSDPLTELTILGMLRYSLEHADKHMPCKESRQWVKRSTLSVSKIEDKVSGTSIFTLMFMAILLGIASVAFSFHYSREHSNNALQGPAISWSSTSHMNSPSKPHGHEYHVMFLSNTESSTATSQFENRGQRIPDTLVRSAQVIPSNSAVDNERFLNRQSQTTSTETPHFIMVEREEKPSEPLQNNHESEVTSSPTSPLQEVRENQGLEVLETEVASVQYMPSRSKEMKSQRIQSAVKPAPRSKSTRHSQRKTRSPSPVKHHSKSAVKWHKIRHLWLDE